MACCEFEPDSDGVIPTTDHAKESLEEAIWYVLNCAIPVCPYDQDWQSVLAICINEPNAANVVRNAFKDPEGFSERLSHP